MDGVGFFRWWAGETLDEREVRVPLALFAYSILLAMAKVVEAREPEDQKGIGPRESRGEDIDTRGEGRARKREREREEQSEKS